MLGQGVLCGSGARAFGDRCLPTPPCAPDAQVGVSDPQHVFCHWTCHGTNLHPTLDSAGRPHKPTFHESVVSGIDYITFCDDRSRMREVVIYRCGVSPGTHSSRVTLVRGAQREGWHMHSSIRLQPAGEDLRAQQQGDTTVHGPRLYDHGGCLCASSLVMSSARVLLDPAQAANS